MFSDCPDASGGTELCTAVPQFLIGDGYCDDVALTEACNFDR